MVRKTPAKKAARKAAPPKGGAKKAPEKKTPPPKPNLAFVRQQLALAQAFVTKSAEVLAGREDKQLLAWCEDLGGIREQLGTINTGLTKMVNEGKG